MNVGRSTRGFGAVAASLFLVLALASAQENPSAPQTPPATPAQTPPDPPPQWTAPRAQAADKTAAPASDKAQPPGDKTFKQEELDQLVAPVALYPDSLLSQVLMAATYPLEVVQTYRWQQANKALKGDALAKALEKQPWDPSVKSLVNFPQVLAMMNEKLDWTEKLGDAFLAQQKDVMDTVQKLRAKAKAEGNLDTSKEQTVVVQPEGQTTVIKIESPDPQVVYVPTYNPTVVYGSWPYPAYPPYYYYPPGYAANAALSFGVGVAVGVAWGYAWGNCNWGHGDVDIDINRNTNINTNIDRSKYKNQINNNRGQGQGQGKGSWQHDPAHRKGVSYRDQSTAQKFGAGSNSPSAKTREAYRGRSDTGASQLNRGGASTPRDTAGSATRPQAGTRDQGSARNTGGGNAGGTRSPSSSGTRSSAFDGINSGGQSTRANSSRGQSSRASATRSSGGGGRGGRGGGGGRRG